MRSGFSPAPWFVAVVAALAGQFGAGCGDAPADPIVLVTDSAQGSAGTGPGADGDLCSPCTSRADCAAGEVCVQLDRGADRFCSRPCGDAMRRCPSDYFCSDVYNLSSLACVPDTGQCNWVIP